MISLRARRNALLRPIALSLLVAYLGGLALVAFWPTPVDRGAYSTIESLLVRLHAHGVPEWFNYGLVEFTANIVLFVPLGLLSVILVGADRVWHAVMAGFASSCLIELGQLVFLPSRFATPVDVLANTLGAVVGALLALFTLAAVGNARVKTGPVPA